MKKIFTLIIATLLICCLFVGCGGPSQYEQDLDSGMDKFSQGDYGSMSDGEKQAVSNFLEWESEQ